MMSERFVYFDLGNVLVTFDHEIAVEQLAHLAQRSTVSVRQTVFESDLQTRFETGLIDGDAFAAEVNERLSTKLPHVAVLESISAIFQPNDSILPVLEKLQSASVPMGVLSNTCSAHWNWLNTRHWPMLDKAWFQQTILSYEVQSMKPAPGIYEASERHAGCAGQQVFFTDDRADNIAAAAHRGWATYRFGSIDGLVTELDKWLMSNT